MCVGCFAEEEIRRHEEACRRFGVQVVEPIRTETQDDQDQDHETEGAGSVFLRPMTLLEFLDGGSHELEDRDWQDFEARMQARGECECAE